MRYAQIRKTDIANGEGIRVSLYVQGCKRHCPNCFNPETWDFTGGNKFDLKTENILIKLVNQPHIVGITILGGEPLELENRQDVSILLKHLKEQCPECGRKMKYLAQIHWDTIEDCAEGTLFIEICPDCKIITMFHQQT